jgi:L-ribulokinase
MTRLKPKTYRPIAAHRKTYDTLYRLYRKLHDAFGGLTQSADLSRVMKDLLEIKHQASR